MPMRATGLCALALLLHSSVAHSEERSSIGALGIQLAAVAAPDDSYLYEPGLSFELLLPYFETGLHIESTEAEVLGGTRSATAIAPVLGTHLEKNWDQEIVGQVFTQMRLPIQRRSGAGQPSTTGLALGMEAGLRSWFCYSEHDNESATSEMFQGFCMGISLALRYQHNLSAYQVGSAVLPEGGGTLSMPFMISLGFNPGSMR